MNEEEKKAVKFFYNLRATIDESNMLFDEEINVKHGKETIKQITIILNLIEKLQKENEELHKEIERMKSLDIYKLVEDWETGQLISVQEVKDKMEKDLKTNEHTILGGRRNGKTLEYGKRLGRIEMCQELLEGRK